MGSGKADRDGMLRGLRVYRASRLEALLGPLEALLEAWPPDELLAPQLVLAAHPGIQRWLTRELARRRGAGDVVANLDVQLPGSWLDAEARARLGASAPTQSPFRREVLRWAVLAALDGSDEPGLQRYLAGADAHRRFQLADRIAAVYARCLVYRADWLAAWEQGRDSVPARHVLGPLWRRVRAALAGEHRGVLLQRLAAARHAATRELDPPPPLHVFGLSHLPASEFAVLCAEARHRLVCLYFPDPCVEYWAGLGRQESRLQRLQQLGSGDEAERELQSLGHPLLAAWGRIGQHFGLSLLDQAGAVVADVRAGEDEHDPPEGSGLLAWLQQGIRRLQPGSPPPAVADALADASLRVHGCHTRVRELEVLRDAVLDALAADPQLKPGDIAVMAPDIHAYAPLLPAIFGAAGDARAELPYHCADLALRRAHPLCDAFLALLQLPRTRIETSQLLDLLQCDAIRRALGIDDEGLDALRRWLDDARVAWGLDASARAQLGLPAYAEHSFAWGLARLVAGHVYGDESATTVAAQTGLWPVAGVQGVAVTALGALDRLLAAIADWCEAASTGLRGSQWCARMESLLDGLFMSDPDDADASAAMASLRAAIRALHEQFRVSGHDPELAHATVCALVDEALARVPEQQPFLLGGITFCGMVPQRSIPFAMIAVLGLNEGDFPRGGSEDGLDLIARHPRIGDRDTRNDDRYLFLETLMAARRRLHLSYHHEGAQDGRARSPAAPLAELMAYLDTHLDAGRPWFVRHPLQPFDARCFDGRDPRLASFSREFAAMVAAASDADADTGERFVAGAALAAPTPDATPLSLAHLLRYYRDPAAHLLRDRLRLRLDALEEDRSAACEPLELKPDPRERLPRQLLLDALAQGASALPPAPPAWLRLSGRLPAGALGMQAYRAVAKSVDPLLQAAAEDPRLARGLPPRQPIAIDLALGARRIVGSVTRVHHDAQGWLLFDAFPGKRLAALGFQQRIPVFIEWALLRLAYPQQPLRVCLLTTPDPKEARRFDELLNAFDIGSRQADLGARLSRLVEFWQGAETDPLRYLPKTAWAAATSSDEQTFAAMHEAWASDRYHIGERDYAPGYAALLARGVDPADTDRPEARALLAHARWLRELLDLDAKLSP
ncbi:MAG: exodeoxyribonuclease V subunit gamma [Xanthomonadales bacterium]|nr:exodeoxyribonuclease V subunit gamma [Xanthomonadales bacterium]